MNIIVSKEQFRCLTEALARKSVLSDTVFVSYGTDKFDKDSDYERYSNRNVDRDMSKYFNGEHPAILAQGHGNGKKAKLARRFDGTIKSGM